MLELIDENGQTRWHDETSLARELGARLGGPALGRYVVHNLGYVAVARSARFLRLSCRPAILSPPTLAATLQVAYEETDRTIGLDYYTGTWNHLVVRDRAKLRCLLAGLAGLKNACERERFLRQPIAPEASPLQAKLDAVRRIVATATSLEEVAPPLNALLGGRWSIYELNAESGDTIVRAIGDRYTPFNPGWLRIAVGNSLASYADDEYARWIASHHQTALSIGQPQFDKVDVILAFPRIGNVRARYTRMTLPVAVGHGPRLVLSTAVTDSAIDLRRVDLDKAG